MYSKILAVAVSVGLFIPNAFASTCSRENAFALSVVEKMTEECTSQQNESACVSRTVCQWLEKSCVVNETTIPDRVYESQITSFITFAALTVVFLFIKIT